MSFRKEKKVRISSRSDNLLLRKKLIMLGMKPLFPKRTISSIYFDNKEKSIFTDSEEGCLPRKKIRIREYPNSLDKKFQLEVKTSSVEGRHKVVNLINTNDKRSILQNGFYDNYYGLCRPVSLVVYDRQYFILDKIRITFDDNISYKSLINNRIAKDKETVMEMKAGIEQEAENLIDILELRESRFSKFARSLDQT